MGENKVFSKRMTQIIKGIAIIAMFIHHMFPNNPGIPVVFSLSNIKMVIATSGKVCVCLFTILSGYGIVKSWENKSSQSSAKFIAHHIAKLLISFIFIYIFCSLCIIVRGGAIWTIYGKGVLGAFYFIKDILGMQNLVIATPTLVGAWWYMETIYICYILFPIIFEIMKRGKKMAWVCLIVSYLPWITYQVLEGWNWHTDREIFYLFAFELGMYCAIYNVFDKMIEISNCYKWRFCLLSIVAVGVMEVIRSRYCLIVDPFLAMAIIAMSIGFIIKIPIVSDLLKELGENSSDMYMFHVAILSVFACIPFKNSIYRVICFIFICWAIALALKKIKEILGYERIIKHFL